MSKTQNGQERNNKNAGWIQPNRDKKIQTVNEMKSWSLETEIRWQIPTKIEEMKKEKIQINKIRNEKGWPQ
jgi:hypothetical protein